jgi:hypothetical protein
MNWQPIETAPIKPFDKEQWFMRHSERVLLFCSYPVLGTYGFTKRGKSRWTDDGNRIVNPTHWMPLPPPPTSGSKPSTEGEAK